MKVVYIAACVLLSACTRAPAGPVAVFREKASKARLETAACEGFRARYRLAGLGAPLEAPHSSRELALKSLRFLEENPLAMPRSGEAMIFLRLHFDELAGQMSGGEAFEGWSPECSPLDLLREIKALLRDEKAYGLTGAERKRIAGVTKAFLQGPVYYGSFSLTPYLFRAAALEDYLERSYEGPSRERFLAQARELNLLLDISGEIVKESVRQCRGGEKEPAFRCHQAELDWTLQVRRRYDGLVADAFAPALAR